MTSAQFALSSRVGVIFVLSVIISLARFFILLPLTSHERRFICLMKDKLMQLRGQLYFMFIEDDSALARFFFFHYQGCCL